MSAFRRHLAHLVLVAGIATSWAGNGRADAPPGRYTVMNGTVYDTKTKLTWQQVPPVTEYNWSPAQTMCANLDLEGGGWRLPSVKELQTLVDETVGVPLIDQTVFPLVPNANTSFWTSSQVVGASPSQHWTVFFGAGFTAETPDAAEMYARCVR